MAEAKRVEIAHAGGKLIVTGGDKQSSYVDGATFEYRGQRVSIKGGRLQTVKKRAEEIKLGLDIDLARLSAWNNGCVL